jgi:hypothetical protein
MNIKTLMLAALLSTAIAAPSFSYAQAQQAGKSPAEVTAAQKAHKEKRAAKKAAKAAKAAPAAAAASK